MHSQDQSAAGRSRLRFRFSFGSVFALALVLANLLALYFAWEDQGWGALWIAFIGAPSLNAGFILGGYIAMPFLRRKHPQPVMARYLALITSAPIVAIVVDALIIFSMGLHGC